MQTLKDNFGRKHNYLRISITERCNLRCTYCMPENGVILSPKAHLMTADEVYSIASTFVKLGVTKIRLTGGEPLVRKDAPEIIEKLSTLPVELSITTNAVIVDRFTDLFKSSGIKTINVSLDSLKADKFKSITRRDDFERVMRNMEALIAQGFRVKLNCVLMKGFNDNEIADFISYTKDKDITVRFIEFMPFDGNRWNKDKLVSEAEVLEQVNKHWQSEDILRIADAPNDTSRNYKIKGYQGSFAIISTVTNPFCDTCNRVRLTANGRIKNCLFSNGEVDLLSSHRRGEDITPLIEKAVKAKFAMRGGMDTDEAFSDPSNYNQNRSMITIGG